jgi:hypothetical protein
MRRPLKRSATKLSADSQRLILLAQAIIQSSGRLEERAWETQFDALLQKLFRTHHQETVDAALDHAFKAQPGIYDVLMQAAEAASESWQVEHEGVHFDALLIAAPILAWTRFSIASGSIPAESAAVLSEQLRTHVLAPNSKFALAPWLYSIDQLPKSHAETFSLMQQLIQAALKNIPVRPPAHPAETIPFLADTRYVLACVIVPSGGPVFKWQTELSAIGHEHVLSQWKLHARPCIEQLLPGCGVELLLPTAYYSACRDADREIRPHSVQAAVHYLTHALDLEAGDLQAIIGGFGEDIYSGQIDEYRISFSIRQEEEVIYGVVWPLYDQEDDERPETAMLTTTTSAPASAKSPALQEMEELSPLNEIISLLKNCGIAHIKRHPGCFPMDSCEDCGMPLYLDLNGELVHPEMPEDAPQEGKVHFH